MRAIPLLLSVFCLTAAAEVAPPPPMEFGTPAAAFAGGPIRLSKTATDSLSQHFHGDHVPLVPQPLRGRLDTALVAHDWPKIEALKKTLLSANGLDMVLMWEQTRFIATGGLGIAELHARDIAASGNPGVSEAAAMLWLYAAGVTFTDGHQCADEAARDTHLDRLRGPSFALVTRILQTLPDDRVAALRDQAIKLEKALAPERNDDFMCRDNVARPVIRPDADWKPLATATRDMLPKHLAALCAVMRTKTKPAAVAVKSAPAKPENAKPAPVKPGVAPFDPGDTRLDPAPAKP